MTSDAAGDILTYTGTDYTRLGIGAVGRVLKVASGGTAVEWATDTAGTGDVVGPGSATDDALARFNLTTGKLIQNSTATLSDAGTLTATAFSGPLTSNVTGNASGTAATVTGATQSAITSVGTLTGFTSTGIDDNANALAITIDINENVGIGTATPDTKFHVEGATDTTITVKSTTASSLSRVYLGTDNADNAAYLINYGSGHGNANLFAVKNTYGSIFFAPGASGTATEKMRINPSDIRVQAQSYFPESQLSFNATQTWDVSTNQVCRVVLTANVTFSAPTNQLDGAFYSIMVEQDGTGGFTGSWNTVFKWAAATAPTLTTTASAKDIFVFRSDGTNMYEVGRQLNVS